MEINIDSAYYEALFERRQKRYFLKWAVPGLFFIYLCLFR